MFLINLTSPMTLILMALMTILLIFLGQEIKKSTIAVVPLIIHLGDLVIHTIQVLTLSSHNLDLRGTLIYCIIIDFVFILISFFSYLWVDDLEAKALNKKNLDSSLDWFWKKI